MAITFFIFITILFVLFRIVPGDPTTLYIVEGMTEQERQNILEAYGLNRPLYEQYIIYLTDLAQGDMGESYRYGVPVTEVLWVRFWNTIWLAYTGLVLAYIGGALVGAVLGWYRGTNFEKAGVIATIFARSSPEFFVGIVMLLVFAFGLGWFPTGGMRTPGFTAEGFWDRYLAWDFVHHMFLPIITSAIYSSALPILIMRSSMVETLHSDFIEVKQAEGLPTWVILFKHTVRNSMLPVVTIIAVTAGTTLSGSLVIETIYSWPGMGREMVLAMHNHDYPVATGAFMFIGSLVILANFMADLLYAYLDPRIAYE